MPTAYIGSNYISNIEKGLNGKGHDRQILPMLGNCDFPTTV